MFLFLIGLFCLLLVVGKFTKDGPLKFATKSLIALIATSFLVVVLLVVGQLLKNA